MESTTTCEPCEARGNITRASKYCFTCQESHCIKCAEVHKSSKATRTHLLVHIKDIQLSVKLSNELKSQQMCEHHAGKYLEYFCVDHREFLCRTCLLMKRHCSRIIHISAPCSLDLERKVLSDKICDDLDQTILKAKYAKERIQDAVERSKSVDQQISDKFDAIRDRFLMHFEEQKSYILNHAKKKITRQTDLSKQMVDGVDELITEAEGTETILKEIKNEEQTFDIVHWIMLSIDKIKELQKRTDEICAESSIIHAEFENTSLTESIEKKEPFVKCSIKETKVQISNCPVQTSSKEEIYEYLCSRENIDEINEKGKSELKTPLGSKPLQTEQNLDNKGAIFFASLDESHADIALPDNTDISSSTDTSYKLLDKVMTSTETTTMNEQECVQFRHSGSFDIIDKESKIINVNGIVCLYDNRLVISDNVNMRLVVLSTDHMINKIIPVKFGPRYVSVFNQEMFIVCLSKSTKIILMEILNTEIKVGTYLKTRFYPRAAHASGSDMILVTMQDESLVWHADIIYLNGSVMQTIRFNKCYCSFDFAVPTPDFLSNKVAVIFYSEKCGNVRCINLDGKEVFRYKVDDVSNVQADQRGNVFIVRYSGEVLVLSSDGKLKGSFNNLFIERATYLAINSSMNKLHVTTYNPTKIHILDVTYNDRSM